MSGGFQCDVWGISIVCVEGLKMLLDVLMVSMRILMHVIKMSLGSACQTSLGPHIFTIMPD